jgi:electron transfer flavoprotein beta subunit
MNIIVLVKQVPDISQLSGSVDGLQLMADGAPRVINPWDEYAVETALQLKEAHGGKVTALCLGQPTAVEALKTALAMGVDQAVLVSDPALANSDSLATARTLAATINKIGNCDLLIAGRSGIFGNTWATAVQVAALLNIPHVSYVAQIKEISAADKTITVVRQTEKARETVSSRLPASISVVKEINEPRYPSFMGIRKASKATIPTWSLTDLGVSAGQVGAAGSQAQWTELSLPPVRETNTQFIEGSPAEAAKMLVKVLTDEKLV